MKLNNELLTLIDLILENIDSENTENIYVISLRMGGFIITKTRLFWYNIAISRRTTTTKRYYFLFKMIPL